MSPAINLKQFLIAAPVLVLLFARLIGELSIHYLPTQLSWLPAFAGYYLAIGIVFYIAGRFYHLPLKEIFSNLNLKPTPPIKSLFWLIIIPALLPISAFVSNVKYVTPLFMLYILLFSIVNPFFEEGFWRGLLRHIPGSKTFKVIYTAALFAFSHYFLWGYWFKTWWVIGPAVFSTFVMGVLWMLFMQKQPRLIYPILSHVVVDILNLSVAVYYGMVSFGH
jgi:membrane protease YdiL (CAAX protease family)